MEPIITTRDLRVVYNQGKSNEYVALDNINLEIYPMEYVILFGPSGCGKSTLLYTILGLQPTTSGQIMIKGVDVNTYTEDEKLKRTRSFFGIVFQQFNLIFSLDVLDNVALPQVFMRTPMRERVTKAMTLLKRFGIEARAKRLPGSLSGGQQQRVAIGRALINDPEVLLADEPVGNLDSESAAVVMLTLKEIQKKDKKTVILVTHDASYLPFADRIYFMKDAKIDHVVVNKPGLAPDEGGRPELESIERLAHAYPFMSVQKLKAWSLTNWMVQEMTTTQMERIEAAMEELIEGKIHLYAFFEFLDKPYSEGGVGLYHATAFRYAKRVGKILHEVREYLKGVKDINKPTERAGMVHLLRKALLEEYSGELSPQQMERLEKALTDRVMNTINRDDFRKALDIPFEDGGIGLNVGAANRLSEKIEVILAQNVT